jgi:GNAT superfamily N-acetyltransferase
VFRLDALGNDSDYDLEQFTCGTESLDSWLKVSARHAMRMGTARTYVWLTDRDGVAAYYAVAPHAVRRDDDNAITRGSPDPIPCLLLAKLALGTEFQGEGNGSALLADALRTMLEAMRAIGGRLVVVDAIDEGAAAFYRHHGFSDLSADPRRLCIKASSAAKSLGVEWP